MISTTKFQNGRSRATANRQLCSTDTTKFIPLLNLDWQAKGACANKVGGVTLDDFFFEAAYEESGSVGYDKAKAKVKAVCGMCPVRQQCLDHAVDNDERSGFWGGMTRNERRRYRVKRDGLRG